MSAVLRHQPHGILIPAYNAARSLRQVLIGIMEVAPGCPVLVVDDGSSDGTAAVATPFSTGGVTVVSHAENRGKGAALATGLRHAKTNLGWDWAITLDADGQHASADLEKFLSAIPDSRTGILVGTRRREGSDMPWHRRFSNASTTWLVSRLAGVPVFDAQCGYRAYRLALLESLPAGGRFEWEAEALIRAARAGWKIETIPIRTVYAGEESHMNLVRDTLRFLRMAGRLAWTR
jgi:glycosyltransferase involved in cell wall biosynthesis